MLRCARCRENACACKANSPAQPCGASATHGRSVRSCPGPDPSAVNPRGFADHAGRKCGPTRRSKNSQLDLKRQTTPKRCIHRPERHRRLGACRRCPNAASCLPRPEVALRGGGEEATETNSNRCVSHEGGNPAHANSHAASHEHQQKTAIERGGTASSQLRPISRDLKPRRRGSGGFPPGARARRALPRKGPCRRVARDRLVVLHLRHGCAASYPAYVIGTRNRDALRRSIRAAGRARRRTMQSPPSRIVRKEAATGSRRIQAHRRDL